jgi:hypothetical protein
MSKVAKRLYAVWLQAIFQNITEALTLFLRSQGCRSDLPS